MTIHTEADIVGAGTKVVLGIAGQFARRILLTPTGGKCRFGDTNVSASQGVELNTDVETTISANDSDISDRIDLSQAWIYVPNGTTVTVTWLQ